MTPRVLSNVVSTILYEKRFGPYFVEPVVCGLEEKDGELVPYISAYDLIGAGLFAEDFVLAGTSSEALYGLCESFYKPDLVCFNYFFLLLKFKENKKFIFKK